MIFSFRVECPIMTENALIKSEPFPQPVTERVSAFWRSVTPEKFDAVRREAFRKLRLVKLVRKKRKATGAAWRKCLSQVAPEVPWSTYLNWRRRLGVVPGPRWERLFDTRNPPAPRAIPREVVAVVIALRRGMPGLTCQECRVILVAQFRESGQVSDSALYRIWRNAGLIRRDLGDPGRFERIELFNGGGGLALISAAALETGVPLSAAIAALEAGRQTAQQQASEERDLASPASGRDDKGRFTENFNRQVRQNLSPGESDPRLASDAEKRDLRDLSKLQILGSQPDTLAQRLLAMGLIPLLTERRGFDGLDGPKGAWLAVLDQPAYRAATLDKTLNELAHLKVDEALWEAHAREWAPRTLNWSKDKDAPNWLQAVRYIDATSEPYFTDKFAKFGKVERRGQTMPCLSRIAVMGGAGVVLHVNNFAGACSLRTNLIASLKSVEGMAPPPETGWLVVVDAEAAVYHLLTTLKEMPGYSFITVLKGQIRNGAHLEEANEWQPYRDRDRIRGAMVNLRGARAPEGGLRLRCVEMERVGGRWTHSTLFVSDADPEAFSDKDLVDAYLSRWPNQEAVFRNARNGGGLERTHGYGGHSVTNLVLQTKQEAAQRKHIRNQSKALEAKQWVETIKAQEKPDTPEAKEFQAEVLKKAQRQLIEAEKASAMAEKHCKSLDTYPASTFVRDTTRENIASSLSVMVICLIEWVLREYFGGLKIELRTFIEHFVHTPVKVRTTARRQVYELEANPRNEERTNQLRAACEEINRRRIKRYGRVLKFFVVDPPPPVIRRRR